MSAGALSGLGEGALFAVLSDPLASGEPEGSARPPAGTLGFVRLTTLDVNSSLLEPVAWQGWAAPAPGLLPTTGAWVRLVTSAPSFALRVSADPTGCRDCPAARALSQLQRDGVPGVDVRWVGKGDATDVQLLVSDQALLLRMAFDATAQWSTPDPARSGNEASLDIRAMVRDAAGALHRVARARNLLQLAAGLALRAPTAEMRLRLTLRRRASHADVAVTPDQLTPTESGDLLLLEGRNEGTDPVDFSAFWLGADQSIRQVYPQDLRESPRIAAGERIRRIGLAVDSHSIGTERLLVLAVPMRRGQDVSDFRFLEQSPLERHRGAADPDLQALFDACFADYRVRGSSAHAVNADRLTMQVYTFQVRP